MDCPKCVGIMEEIRLGNDQPLIINRCPACGGLWFDKNELTLAINKLIKDTSEFDLELEPVTDVELLEQVDLDKTEINCLCCKNSKMTKIPSKRNPKITMDYCQKCGGIWLDAGEFKIISKRSKIEESFEKIIDFFRLNFPHIFKGT